MAQVILPHGFPVGEAWHREAELRRVGEAELWAARLPADSAIVSRLLALCLERLGPYAPVLPEQVAALTVGDREALLLHLRRITIGEQLECHFPCSACGERMEVGLTVGDLLLAPYESAAAAYSITVDGTEFRVRPPTGADQAAVAVLASVDLEGATEALLRSCLEPGTKLAPDQVASLSAQMQALDPQGDLVLDFQCPACGAAGRASLSAADYLVRELVAKQEAVLREIHLLALHYHWSEAEIMAVPPARRQQYLRLLGLAD
jgi:predicted RNA-binding Zn-ribbon protein involved in translation (DUF1610 family)